MLQLPDIQSHPVVMEPRESVQIANELADRSAEEPFVRQLAARIVRDVEDVPADGARAIAEWIRAHVLYTQEAVGREILQGPATTLRIRTGDCDDLSILFASLCRSINLDAHVVGLGHGDRSFFHAVGLYRGELYELSLDHTYVGGKPRPIIIESLQPGIVGWGWDVPTASAIRVTPRGSEVPAAVVAATSMHGVNLASLGRRIAADLGKHGIQLTQESVGPRGVEGALQDLTGSLAEGLADAGGAGQVIGGIVKAASGAAGGGVLAVVGALGAASGPIGAAVAVAAAVGKALGALTHARRNVARAGNRYEVAAQTIVKVLRPDSQQMADVFRARVDELIPRMSNTVDRRTRGRRRLGVATLNDRRPPRQATWADGSRAKRRGVLETFRPRFKRQSSAMRAHTNAAIALSESLAQIPLEARRAAFLALVLQHLGRGGLRGMPLPPGASSGPGLSTAAKAALGVGTVAAAALMLR